MIGYEDYNALGLPTEYAMQDRIEQMENKVLKKLKSSGLDILADKLIDTEVWHNAIDAMMKRKANEPKAMYYFSTRG
ncbi:hypothetical protein DPV86_04150 [Haemophilus parahaemolyticus]|uniref:hypothetical protein n=1 Tax=Haemophilus parahaemolyticus TaxID=735 RepID=UPI000DADBBE1|nr:hypothetical protein [Haemophilus parahaemolyticus]RDE83095.1 hypothetical protein DPV86_04150 [Haemophilus parahaemolyticus]